jgi:anti-sigma B factor antagonist
MYPLAMPTVTREDGGASIIAISGRLTLGREIEQLETAMRELMSQGKTRFIFDMGALDYIDSSGIGTVVSCLTDVKRAGGELRLAGVNARLRRLFQLTGVDALVTMFPSVAEAAAS